MNYIGGFNVDNAKISSNYQLNISRPVTIHKIKANIMLT